VWVRVPLGVRWDPDRRVVKWQNLPRMQRLIGVGMDYGTTNATTGLLLGLSKELNHLIRTLKRTRDAVHGTDE
jgi:hypothetical protein